MASARTTRFCGCRRGVGWGGGGLDSDCPAFGSFLFCRLCLDVEHGFALSLLCLSVQSQEVLCAGGGFSTAFLAPRGVLRRG